MKAATIVTATLLGPVHIARTFAQNSIHEVAKKAKEGYQLVDNVQPTQEDIQLNQKQDKEVLVNKSSFGVKAKYYATKALDAVGPRLASDLVIGSATYGITLGLGMLAATTIGGVGGLVLQGAGAAVAGIWLSGNRGLHGLASGVVTGVAIFGIQVLGMPLLSTVVPMSYGVQIVAGLALSCVATVIVEGIGAVTAKKFSRDEDDEKVDLELSCAERIVTFFARNGNEAAQQK